MKRILKFSSFTLVALLLTSMFTFSGCEELDDVLTYLEQWTDQEATTEGFSEQFGSGIGWLQKEEDLDKVESAVSFGSVSSNSLPASVDLRNYFPPIGNQGQYGTCVAWAVAYNGKTAIEAMDQGWTGSDLASASRQFSPKDLFWSVPDSDKGEDCNGTWFEPALDVLVSRGLATLATVPYSNLGNCSKANTGGESEASNNKIENYRKIDNDPGTIKNSLAKNQPVIFGARLGDQFVNYEAGQVITYQDYNYTGMHAYHAMILAGYDDSKQAFLVVNSWGSDWGDQGICWVGYDYFSSYSGGEPNFCFGAFVANNKRNDNAEPDNDGDGDVDNVVDGVDLQAWWLTDQYVGSSNWEREITYNIYNTGNEPIPASADWSMIYIYYNAYDADDMGILLHDYYSDDWASSMTYGEFVNYDENHTVNKGPYNGYNFTAYNSAAINYADIPAGSNAVQAVGGDDQFTWGYTLPDITGEYYMILWVDPFDILNEDEEDYNFVYFTAANGDPLYIQNGNISENLTKSTSYRTKGTSSLKKVKNANPNAYTSEEIAQALRYLKTSGLLQQKLNEYNQKGTKSTKRVN